MRAIFISYRRSDSEGQAGRLFDDLKRRFGADAVFMDVAGIEAGRDFRKAIDDQVTSCGVLLSIIGKSWLTATNERGVRRLDDPADFVQLETASALKRDIPVVPVLVQGAGMPTADQLPDTLKDLSYRNGVELTHARWDSDVELLIKALEPIVKSAGTPTAAAAVVTGSGESSHASAGSIAGHEAAVGMVKVRFNVWAVVACVAIALLGVGGLLWYRASPPHDVVETIAPSVAQPATHKSPVPAAIETVLTYRDWEGKWSLEWEFEDKWYRRPMTIRADQSGITGEYVNGILEAKFEAGDFSKLAGEVTNTTGTGTTCPSGKQTGSFQLTLASDGQSMEGWWDVCGEGRKWRWRTHKR